MRFEPRRTLLIGLLLVAACLAAQAQPWPTATAESQGLDRAKLDAARNVLAVRRTKNFLVVRNGQIVYEWYSPDSGPNKRHGTASLAKALVGGISLMFALQDGRLSIDDPAAKYIPAWRNDRLRSKITIRHLATHTSGIEDAEQDDLPHEKLPGWKGAFWRREPDPFTIAIHQAPMIFEPGAKYAYSNPGMAALAYAVTASLQGAPKGGPPSKTAPQSDIRALLKQRVFDPIGLTDEEWSIGYGRAYEVDRLQLYANWGGGEFTARAAARVGQWMLQRGGWGDRQLIDPAWVDRAVAYSGMPKNPRKPGNPNPASGLSWWINQDSVWRGIPSDAFAGAGARQQVLLVVPSLKLVVVRNGEYLNEPDEKEGFWGTVEKYLFNPVIDAVAVDPPYPPSAVIKSVKWAPAGQVVRLAPGGDNWPMTWADDDVQYTAYGDGWGFEPLIDVKLSLGLAKVLGPPDRIQGKNLRSKSAERVGQGEAGEKASGILMVDGILYLWTRNTGNSRLGWSRDHGHTWIWSDWRFTTSFGHPAFLNFGKNYAGARDGYVYVYSPDRDSAYLPADRLVLARVPKGRIRDQSAYEFFQEKGRWTKDITHRGSVFSFPGLVYRSQVSYNPGLKRYLLCAIVPIGDTRFGGGFGIYDAPEPWGPWTTVYFAQKWDVAPGENCSFPTKWMSADGETAHLVFSGDDAFSARKVTLGTGR